MKRNKENVLKDKVIPSLISKLNKIQKSIIRVDNDIGNKIDELDDELERIVYGGE